MNYQVFRALVMDALEQADHELYIGERGWQPWMDDYGEERADEIARILELAWIAARGTITQLRVMSGMSRAAWCRAYGIPIRTAENWDAEQSDNTRSAPSYVRTLIAYSMI